MTATPSTVPINPSDSELMVKRLFKIAEILSRKQSIGGGSESSVENNLEKHGEEEIGYRENEYRLNDA